jgi:hypothetical protein
MISLFNLCFLFFVYLPAKYENTDESEEGTQHFMVNVIEPQFNLHSEGANVSLNFILFLLRFSIFMTRILWFYDLILITYLGTHVSVYIQCIFLFQYMKNTNLQFQVFI